MKILICGGTGLLAKEMERFYTLVGHSVEFLSRNPSENSYCVNFLNKNELLSSVKSIDFDFIINTVAMTNVEKCEENFYSAYQANALVAKNISFVAAQLNKKLVHISTDHFASQKVDFSTESDIGIPKNTYASTKLIAEKEVMQESQDALVVRTNFFGWGRVRDTFSDRIIRTLRNGQDVRLFKDVFYTPILIDNLCEVILLLCKNNAEGIYNVTSNEKVSKYDFGNMIAEIFGLDKTKIIPISIKDLDLVDRPENMALSNTKVKSIFPGLKFDLLSQIKRLKEIETGNLSECVIGPKMLSYGKQNVIQQDFDYVINTLGSDYLTQGPKVVEFEERLAEYVGAKYAVAMCNLTCGLHAIYMALGLQQNDYIITTPVTFVSTSNAALFCGAKPLFADINPETLNIDPQNVKKLFEEYGSKIKGVVPVHFAGAPCDMEAIKKIADVYGAWVVEDAAHSLGGSYLEGGKIGSCSNSMAAGFSFHPVKNITMGEGGVITTNNERIYHQLLKIRSHGITKGEDKFLNKQLSETDGKVNPWYYEMHQLGFNFRITDLQCSLGLSQLSRLDSFFKRRIRIGKMYDEAFKNLRNVKVLQHMTREISGNHLYVVKINFNNLSFTRLELFDRLKKEGVNLHVHYIPVTEQPYYKEYESLKNSTDYYESAITLPFYSSMDDCDVDKVIKIITKEIG